VSNRSDGRKVGLAESSIHNALTSLRVVLRFAQERRYVRHNPVDDLVRRARPRPNSDRRPIQVLREPELDRLIAAARHPYSLMFKLAAWTGLRSAELRGLIWDDLDLEHGAAVVSRQIDSHDRGERVRLKSKGLTEVRRIPLMIELVEELGDLRARQQEMGVYTPEGWVFQSARGKHVSHSFLEREFKASIDRAGIERLPEHKLSPHSLRHGFGSMMLHLGEPVRMVATWLGHSKVSTTERWYSHELDAMQNEAATRMVAKLDERRQARAFGPSAQGPASRRGELVSQPQRLQR
jgi:integrase